MVLSREKILSASKPEVGRSYCVEYRVESCSKVRDTFFVETETEGRKENESGKGN